MIPIFYTDPNNISQNDLFLDKEEARHLRNVMRLKKGDSIIVVDGAGNGYRCEIAKVGRDKINVSIISRIRNFGEPLNHVTLAAGISTGGKFSEIIEKATETGISRIIPLLTEKSKVKLDDPKRLKSKLTRWRKVAIAAMKQSRRSLIPEILEPRSLDNFIKDNLSGEKVLMFDPSEGAKSFDQVQLNPDEKKMTIIVGPESGFSDGEIESAKEFGLERVSLGPRILRAENAAPVCCALVMFLLGELR